MQLSEILLRTPHLTEHAANLGAYLAKELGDKGGIPAFFVDPVCVDELDDVARYSGLRVWRDRASYALNQNQLLERQQRKEKLEDLNLVA